ncbi:MAG: hypothetical protein R3246_16785 [Acidimicrobiia bacterium]|nr:hypothetical protein [Acidimicrobiia bacterium]
MRSATLDDDAIRKIEEVEAATGTTLVAYEPGSPYAQLDGDQLDRIRQLESELGLIVVAYPRTAG